MEDDQRMKEIILDLDGTLSNESFGDLADISHPDEIKVEVSKFTPKKGVDILKNAGIKPIIITGRQEYLRDVTTVWLHSYGIPVKKLVMAPDRSYGDEFSWEKYLNYKVKAHEQYDVRFSIDNNAGLITVLKKHGIAAYLVGDDFEQTFIKAWQETE